MINFHNKSQKTYSLRKRILLIFTVVLISFFLIFASIIGYFTQVIRERTYESVHSTLEVYNQQLSHNLNRMHIFMFDMSEYGFDMKEVFTTSNVSTVYNKIIRSKELLDYSIPSFSEIDGMCIYATLNDTFIQSYKYQDSQNVSNFLKDQFRSASGLDNINVHGWYSEKINDEYYLIRIINVYNAYIGTWSKVTRLTSTFENVSKLNGQIVYVDDKGSALSTEEFNDYTFPVDLTTNDYHIINTDSGKALLVLNTLDYCDYYLAAVIPLKNIDNQLDPLYTLLFILLIITLMFTFVLVLSVTKFLSKPIRLLEDAATRMRDGDFEQKFADNPSDCQEIIEIDTAFNRMIDEIHNLRIDIYEENIARSELELEYLKSQIAPHFLINCLFSIMTLADQPKENQGILHKMIETLSSHLRYTLTHQTKVALEQELSYVDNYIELTKLRFPGCLNYTTDISPATKDASVFPLILLMLTENSIKFNMVMGEMLDITIVAKIVNKEHKSYLHLTHIDSGSGFPSSQLDELKAFSDNPSMQTTEFGTHLGIPNVAKRLRILYGSEGKIFFSNENGSGARIDIEIPYLEFNNNA